MTEFQNEPPPWTEISTVQIAALCRYLQSDRSGTTLPELHAVQHWVRRVVDISLFSGVVDERLMEQFVAALEHVMMRDEIAMAGLAALQLARLNSKAAEVVGWIVRCLEEPAAVLCNRCLRIPTYTGEVSAHTEAVVSEQLRADLAFEALSVVDEMLALGVLPLEEQEHLERTLRRIGYLDVDDSIPAGTPLRR